LGRGCFNEVKNSAGYKSLGAEGREREEGKPEIGIGTGISRRLRGGKQDQGGRMRIGGPPGIYPK